MATFSVEIPNLRRIQARLDPEGLYWGPMKTALDELGKIGAGDARASASRFARTGTLAGGITHKVNAAPAPRWVAITTDATSRTGQRYPWILEFDAKYHHKNWLRDAIRRAQNQAASVLGKAVREIESNWGRR